jgi:hypothetical protein
MIEESPAVTQTPGATTLNLKALFHKSVRAGDSMHTLIGNEIQFLLDAALGQCTVAARKSIVTAVGNDPMNWFIVRDRRYGESGGHYGVTEIVAKPGGSDPQWPAWVALIPTAQLRDVGLAASQLSKERRPFGGHMMDEENRRRAVCEFADQILWRLLFTETEVRSAASPANT